MTDDELDRRFRALREEDPPELLVRRTRARVAAERAKEELEARSAPSARTRILRRRWGLLAAALVMMALSFSRWGPTPDRVDPSALVPKGVAVESLPSLELELTLRRRGGVERYAGGEGYAVGDVLLFRVTVDRPMTLTIFRDGASLWTGPVPAGATVLPVGWTVEAGEGPAELVVEGEGVRVVRTTPGVRP